MKTNKNKNKNEDRDFDKLYDKYSKPIFFVIKLIIISLIMIVIGTLFFPEETFYIIKQATFGKMMPEKEKVNNSEQYDEEDKKSTEENDANFSKQCDSNFLDDKWEIDNWWIQNGQEFVFIPDETKKGGPKMDFKNLANDNFKLTFKFEPVTNENNKNNEINLVIYIGDLYKIVLGDGNREKFYLKSDGEYISEIKTKLNIIPFEHPIMFDEWTTIEIDQNVSSNSKTRSIKVSFDYCPFIFGKDGCNKNQPEIYLFELDDSSDPEKVLRLISIGLRNSSSVIKTRLCYFELKNR